MPQAEGASRAEQPPATETAAPVAAAAEGDDDREVIEFPEGGKRIRSSPLVRKIAKERGVNLAEVAGTGLAGRITKEDIVGHLNRGGAQRAPAATAAQARPGPVPGPALD